jgi:hypothetical protein
MSMSEFERQENKGEGDLSSLSIQRCELPDDFTEEDLAFAAELCALFSLEEEKLPPYYVQTLLDAEDQRFKPAERGFEQRASANVFRRLKLRRHLFSSYTSPLGAISARIGDRSMRRSLLALATAFLLVMMLTVAFTGESFAAGVAILLRGTHGSGVSPTNHYPTIIQHPQYNWQSAPEPTAKSISFEDAQSRMFFQMYWPQYMLSSYSLEHINLYVGLDQQWSDGPMLEFEYSLPPSSVAPRGTGEIWVREFKPRADVLQIVKDGAFLPIGMDNSGSALAIYVDGQWSPRGKNSPEWVYGGRSELIYQVGGVVFWIVGDQRDGVGKEELMQIASGLAPSSVDQFRVAGISIVVTQMSEDVPGPFSNDVIQVFPNDGTGDSYDVSVSSYQPPKKDSHAP